MKKKIVSLIVSLCFIISIFSCSIMAFADSFGRNVTVGYQGQCQKIGWGNNIVNGNTCGTVGKSLRLEALRVMLSNQNESNSIIQYQVYAQTYGWMNPVSNGDIAGTQGKSKRLEGIRITIKNLDGYQVHYRVQQQSVGWTDWVTVDNGTSIDNALVAGVIGKSLRIEAIEIKLSQPLDDNFQTYLNSNYNSYTINKVTAKFNWQVNKTDDYRDYDEEICDIMNLDQYSAIEDWGRFDYKTDAKIFVTNVCNEIKKAYPNKSFHGCIKLHDTVDSLSSTLYDISGYYKTSNHDGLVSIDYTAIEFYSTDGNNVIIKLNKSVFETKDDGYSV